ncbi:MAG: phosphoribosylaminoimidazolesuccinocarboxamide synthase [bacterium]|nr:phosphoribosylaminoimidazolesuccinocarboxamide synthase [bacterium]
MINKEIIEKNLENCLIETNFDQLGKKYNGKVRDTYEMDGKLVLITTDRQSAFDRVLAAIPFKGQVLNQVSQFWFEQTKDIVQNHVLSIPDPNVTIGKKSEVFPVEFVMRGYLTGVTSTAVWTAYEKGERDFCGNILPEGMVKNQAFDKPIITPTTKSDEHDEKISPEEIVQRGLMSQEDWDKCADIAMQLFVRGQEIAKKNGMILVDTKYEMGKDKNGEIILVDEIHTPDSSRYWVADSFEAKLAAGKEPDNIDKEFLRLWFTENCDPYNDETLPEAPKELVVELSARYIQLYEAITGQEFQYPDISKPVIDRITENLKQEFPEL